MSWLDFISRVLDAVAWPLVAVFALVMLRKPLARLLTDRALNRIKLGPLDVEWTREIAEAETELNAAGIQTPATQAQSSLRTELAAEARTAPAIAVLEAHSILERQLRRVVGTKTAVPRDELERKGVVGLARLAARHDLIGDETANAIQNMSTLRNMAAHGSARDITSKLATDYLTLVDAVLVLLPQAE